jgi:PhoPQ-activated pathogenicity-related protein
MNTFVSKSLKHAWVFKIHALLIAGVCMAAPPTKTSLDRYVEKPDSTYAWKLINTVEGESADTYILELTSQTWRTTKDVDRPVWKHWMTIIKPKEVNSNKALLLIAGGSNNGDAPKGADPITMTLARSTKSVVVGLGMIPNQPLTFVCDDNIPRKEDDLIAFTWDKYMKTGDDTWPARLPMVKSAVRAMDATQEFLSSEEGGKVKIDEFVVAGGSKRGWTTWLTGAVDKRVTAIVPIVIDVLNVEASMKHHFAAYGFWAPAVGDYVNHKITERTGSRENKALMKIVDPYSYRDRLTMPKFILNGSGDQFFLPDSSQFYYDDLVGEKYLRYVPNADHSLGGSDAVDSVVAFYHSILTDSPRPEYSWTKRNDGSLIVKTKTEPTAVKLWQATNPEARDFRVESIGKVYTSTDLEPLSEGIYVGRVEGPEKGWTAFFIELTYDSKGPKPFKFTTEVSVVPDVLPFADKPLK